MKLLMVTGLGSARDLASGKRGAFYNTLEEFHKYWERVDIICPRVKSGKLKVKSLFGNVFIHISPWPLVFHPFWFLKKGLEIYKKQKFDLMTVQDFPPFYNGIGARLLWQKIKVSYILEFHHIPGYPKAANAKEWFYATPVLWKLYWRIFGSKTTAVRTVNQKQTPEFLKKAGVSENKIVYIPSIYIDLDIFKPVDLQKTYDLIFVGRMESNKGASLFLDAVQKLNCRAIMVGDGSLLSQIKGRAKNLKLDIEIRGRVGGSKDVAELINRSKLLVMPSYNEGGPRVVLEAMACGVPVLATNVGLMPDLAHKNTVNPALVGKGGVKIIDWNAEDIAQKAKELLENESERNKLSKAGLEIAKQFEKKEAIRNYAEKLKQLL